MKLLSNLLGKGHREREEPRMTPKCLARVPESMGESYDRKEECWKKIMNFWLAV